MTRWALLAAAASTLAVSAHAQDAAPLVDRYVAWRGGAAFAKATADVDDKWTAGPIGAYVKKVIAAARGG